MKLRPPAIAAAVLVGASIVALARSPALRETAPAAAEKDIAVYFSPKGGCEQACVDRIAAASKSVDVQAYSFTNHAIASALVDAAGRGVKVRVVLDSKAAKQQNREPDFVAGHGVPTYADAMHQIAHNKVMVIDGATVVAGSFNFTRQAETSNAENLLVIQDRPKIAEAYEQNFEQHLRHSKAYEPEK